MLKISFEVTFLIKKIYLWNFSYELFEVRIRLTQQVHIHKVTHQSSLTADQLKILFDILD